MGLRQTVRDCNYGNAKEKTKEISHSDFGQYLFCIGFGGIGIAGVAGVVVFSNLRTSFFDVLPAIACVDGQTHD